MVLFYQNTGQETKGCSDYAELERQQRRAAMWNAGPQK